MTRSDYMIPPEEALKIMLNSVKKLECESIELLQCAGRILFDDIVADINIPPFDNSAMDGFAVKSEDTSGASDNNPVNLKIIEEIKAGDYKSTELKKQCAVAIMTGSPVPKGSGAVIPVEFTKEENGTVALYKSVKKDENIRFAGEDISINQKVLSKGTILKAADIGILASLNHVTVKVYKKPTVAIISTGDEIVDVGEKIRDGQIRNSNAYTLHANIEKYCGEPHYLGITQDTIEDTKRIISEALEYDIVITTGGVSMGKYDFVKEVLNELGVQIKTEKIRMKPGKPLVFGTYKDTLIFGLPGNPVSTMVSFLEFVRPTMLKMMGSDTIQLPLIKATLLNNIKKKPDRKKLYSWLFYYKKWDFSGLYNRTTGIWNSPFHERSQLSDNYT